VPGGRASRRRAAEQAGTATAQQVADKPAAKPEPASTDKPRRSDAEVARARMIAMSFAIVAVLCLGFVFTITTLGALKEHRDQVTGYDNFRYELANGTAPVGQTDENGVLLEPGTAVALLDFPTLGFQTLVNEGTTSGVLVSGPGHRRDTYLPGQAGVSLIYGRRAAFGGPFGDIASLKPGDQITATTGQAVSTYKVIDVRRANDVIPPQTGKGRMTLVTADGRPYLPDGVIYVDADLTTDVQPANSRIITAAALAPAEFALQGDSSAWFLLLLWAQALLVVSIGLVFAWVRWGRWETWVVGMPILLAVGVATALQASLLLPNLM
jgi:sortase A